MINAKFSKHTDCKDLSPIQTKLFEKILRMEFMDLTLLLYIHDSSPSSYLWCTWVALFLHSFALHISITFVIKMNVL